MRTALPIGFADIAQLQVDLANESRALKDMVGFLPGHVVSRQPIQLSINQGSQPLKRLIVAVPPSTKQASLYRLERLCHPWRQP
jgi:hypothetical protein